ncbi:MAG: dTMP kinase [Candidatus Omnitrophota bacterium]|jgi:dTMP kinase
MKGVFITFEGSEGSGKSTQAALIYKYLQERNRPALHIREPGGVKISEAVRKILLDVRNVRMTKECETLLYMAARAQLVEEKVLPALKQGLVVLCDRFLDSTIAYQGYGNGVDINVIKDIGRMVTQGTAPDLTFLFDIETEKGLERAGQNKDRIELRSLNYHNRVRKGYLKLAQEEPGRIKVIKVNKSKEEIHALVKKAVDSLLGW